MIHGKKILAVVPARRGSKGLPMKNVRPLGGKPLLAWPVEAALNSRYVDRVIVTTEDAEFAAIARVAGADTPFLRPAELARDNTPSIDFLLHAIDTLESEGEQYELLVMLEPTSPLTEASDIDAAIDLLSAREGDAEAIVGVTAMTTSHPVFAVRIDDRGLIQPYVAPNFGQLPRRQEISPLFCLDGSLYISTTAALRRERGFYHKKTLPYVTPRWKSFEVDELVDFVCIEAILAHRDLIARSEP